ncbi:hypothetical protein QBC37DRAFT_406483 [Rhypophila decipiens]|uniref:Uncharacterized protein n=1 Tax=Rhypophila decipiens TaxID=261697 RepID=A0AAN7B261_9PEZI|nr:hypothetical protein QBC37DRAFT_406483 [Rhypophila decipiens]
MPTDTDVLLRLKTSCATAHGNYDQIVAVSQQVINESFDKLYDIYPEYGVVEFSSKKIGKIKGHLNSPRLLLGGGLGHDISVTSALYVMRFKEGKITIPADDDEDPDLEEDLAGWDLAITIDLKEQSVKVDPDADPETQKEQQALWDFIHGKFDVPGNYSIARLYAKLSDSHWKDFDYENSQFGFNADKTPRSWAQLKKQVPGIDISLPFMLSKWAEAHDKKGMTTTGVRFSVPSDEIDDQKSGTDFKPTAMVHQVYGYKNPDKGVPKPVVSYAPPGDLNCFLYCEMVRDHELPTDKQLAGSGNFTAQASEIGGKRIDGTFTISHQLFLESFLLPILQAFNMASIIVPRQPHYYPDESAVGFSYSIGWDSEHQDSTDQFFAFKTVHNPDTPADPISYQFKPNEYRAKLDPIGHSPTTGSYASFESTSNTTVDFEWDAGSASFRVKCFTKYMYDVQWSENQNMTSPHSWGRDTFEASWDMKINIVSVEGGILRLGMDAGNDDNCNATVSKTRDLHENTKRNFTSDEIKDEISGYIKSHVATLKANLSQAFQTSAMFNYPGNGTFDFSDPMIGNTGEILSTIAYKPLPPKTKITIPPPTTITLAPMQHFDFKTKRVNMECFTPLPKLNWSYHKPIKASQTATEVIIQGTNKTAETIALKSVDIVINSESKGRAPVTGTDFTAHTWKLGQPGSEVPGMEGKLNVYQIVHLSAEGGAVETPAFDKVEFVKGDKVGDVTPLTFQGAGEAVLVKPGESVVLALYTGTGVANTYDVKVKEGWEPVKERSAQSLRRSVKIILSP